MCRITAAAQPRHHGTSSLALLCLEVALLLASAHSASPKHSGRQRELLLSAEIGPRGVTDRLLRSEMREIHPSENPAVALVGHTGSIDATTQILATDGIALARVSGSYEAAAQAESSTITTTAIPDHLELLPMHLPREELPSTAAPSVATSTLKPHAIAGEKNISTSNKTANVTTNGSIHSHRHKKVGPQSRPVITGSTQHHHVPVIPRRRRTEPKVEAQKVEAQEPRRRNVIIPRRRRTNEATAKATAETTAKATAKANGKVTAKPTAKPTVEPTAKPTAKPTARPTAATTAKAGKRIDIGTSKDNRKCVNYTGMQCSSDAGNRGIRLNTDGKDDPIPTFKITATASKVCATRTDSSVGWGMNLSIACVKKHVPAGNEKKRQRTTTFAPKVQVSQHGHIARNQVYSDSYGDETMDIMSSKGDTITVMRGPPGAPGSRGPVGMPGAVGNHGQQGRRGPHGIVGNAGEPPVEDTVEAALEGVTMSQFYKVLCGNMVFLLLAYGLTIAFCGGQSRAAGNEKALQEEGEEIEEDEAFLLDGEAEAVETEAVAGDPSIAEFADYEPEERPQ